MSQKIRIKLKSYDHNLVDKSAEKIVRTVKATGIGPLTIAPVAFTVLTIFSADLSTKLWS